ncbi:hypothetical protein CPC08DRAFT_101238 [Agrocybe pediades]|nr:hypothetical protein CPC08DRAFT_101238 [Agrocybe pediades]
MGQPSRYDERDHQRRRREPSPENTNLPRRPNVYLDEPTNARYPDRNMTAAPTMRDRSPPPPPPPESASARKRQPLPPQTKIFQSASSSGSSLRRDAPPHIATGTVQLSTGWADKDPNVPRAPRQRDELVRRPSPAQRPPPPPVDTKMDVDHEDRPKSSGRPSPYDQRAEMEARISHAEANARPRPHPGGPPPRAKYPERRNEDADPGPGRRNEVRSMNNGPVSGLYPSSDGTESHCRTSLQGNLEVVLKMHPEKVDQDLGTRRCQELIMCLLGSGILTCLLNLLLLPRRRLLKLLRK